VEFKEIVAQRFATKKFDGRPVTDELLAELLEIIRSAPSALNLQPWKIKIVADPEVKAELAPVTGNPEMTTSASHILVFCADTDVTTLIGKVSARMTAAGVSEEIRSHVIGLAEGMDAGLSPAEKKEWATRQVYLAVCNAVNGAKSLGFDSCPVTNFQPGEFARILDIPSHLFPVIICPIGYAAHKANPKMRFPVEEIVF